MRKRIMTLLLALGLSLCGCGAQNGGAAGGGAMSGDGSPGGDGETGEGLRTWSGEDRTVPGTEGLSGDGGTGTESLGAGQEESGGTVVGRDAENGQSKAPEGTRVVQGGPYGEISVTLPDGWKYELCPMDSDVLLGTKYGIHFSPEDEAEGYIELAYSGFFGVCGTGLAQEDTVLAGVPVNIGVYDGHEYWDFIRFGEQMEGVVALTYFVADWWTEYADAVMEILDTMSFEPEVKEGGACVFQEESENREIGLYFSLKKISSTGATLVYNQFDPEAPSGELQDGDAFVLERCVGGQWEAVPVVVEGEYGFHDVAYRIPKEEITERELDWEWLYGELAPGEYRLGKRILDFRKTADYDDYLIYAYFFIN